MLSQRLLLRIDYLLLLLALVLSLIGALGAYSAETPGASGNTFVRQLVWIGLGLCVCLVVASVDYHLLTDYAFLLYICAILMLLGVLLFGVEINGSKSWLALGPVRFQPSELGKLVLILTLARYLAGIEGSFVHRRHFLAVTLLTVVPMGLVILQAELETKADVKLDLKSSSLVRCRPQQISAVLSNLLRNAAASVDERGVIEVRSRQGQDLSLSLEPGQPLSIPGEFSRQDLDGDFAL